MDGLQGILKRSVVLSIAVTAGVLVAAGYQMATVQVLDEPTKYLLLSLATYWLGVLTPVPQKLNGK